MSRGLHTDYLVIGAGASGLAFTDVLVAESGAEVLLVDRRHDPGGHWCDTYPFVRLHSPSRYYGVDSVSLGADQRQVGGDNDGLYEQATGAEVQDYFRRVLRSVLEPSGRVRFLAGHEHVGGSGGNHVVRDLTSGVDREVRVRRSVVDARYLEGAIPATHAPSFTVAAGVPFGPVNELPGRADDSASYTIVGGGKTGVDACLWLLDRGTDPERIRWIRPREAWFNDRATVQPLDLIGGTVRSLSLAAEIIAGGGDTDTMLELFEDAGQVMRLDQSTRPTMYRGAMLSSGELNRLRSITDVVRLGRLRAIEVDRLVLDDGEVTPRPDTLYVDCSGYGLSTRDLAPVFGPDRITLQYLRHLSPSFNAALVGWVEAHRTDTAEKNRLCLPHTTPTIPAEWAPMLVRSWQNAAAWRSEPDLTAWINSSRLNLGVTAQMRHDPVVRESVDRLRRHVGPAIERFRPSQVPARPMT
ncbi:MAG: NAD(P)-binding protein [Nocardioides sp.]|nr:NAD(P)-binding protein [Nocardioides sp.]